MPRWSCRRAIRGSTTSVPANTVPPLRQAGRRGRAGFLGNRLAGQRFAAASLLGRGGEAFVAREAMRCSSAPRRQVDFPVAPLLPEPRDRRVGVRLPATGALVGGFGRRPRPARATPG